MHLFMTKVTAVMGMSNTFALETLDINCCVSLTSSPFGNFHCVICVKQLFASLIMLKEPKFMKFRIVKIPNRFGIHFMHIVSLRAM